MIAHIIHDKDGTIKSIVFQGTEIEGDLEIQSDTRGELVTPIDLSQVFPEGALDTGAGPESSRHRLYLMARDIRSGFRLDPKRKTLERLK
jgi:hypothetical protein